MPENPHKDLRTLHTAYGFMGLGLGCAIIACLIMWTLTKKRSDA